MKNFLLIVLLHFCLYAYVYPQNGTVQKKVIKLGWDYFDSNQLLAKGDSIQNNLPFDGIVFSINRRHMQALDTTLLPDSYFKFEQLSQIRWTRFTDNFISLWGFGNNGPYWFNDTVWKKITANLSKLSKAVSESHSKGIFFDAEYYLLDKPDLNPWIYNKRIYPDKSFKEVRQQVTRRGMQTMQALQSNKNDIKIFATWLLGLVIEQIKYGSLENANQALLPAFFEGMMLAKNPEVAIIDGNETGYWYTRASDFLSAQNYLKSKSFPLLDSSVYNVFKKVPVSQPVFFDGLLGKTKEFNRKGYDTIQKQNWLANNLLYALATSEEYMWVYSERINWFTDTGLVKQLKSAKQKLYDLANDSCPKGIFRSDNQVNEQTIKSGNSYIYNSRKKILSLKLYKTPVCVSVFENGDLIESIDSVMSKKTDISLADKYSGKGNLIVMLNYKQNLFATSTEVAIIH